jgi:hypothetical protein
LDIIPHMAPEPAGTRAVKPVVTIDDSVQVYSNRDLGSPVVVRLRKRAEIRLGSTAMAEGREWFEVSFEDKVGFILGSTARGHTTLLSRHELPIAKKPITCPRCSLVSPSGTARCQCGQLLQVPPEQMREQYSSGMREAAGMGVLGALIAITPIVYLIATLSAAPDSPHVLFYGLSIFGLLLSGRSFSRYRDLRAARKHLDP